MNERMTPPDVDAGHVVVDERPHDPAKEPSSPAPLDGAPAPGGGRGRLWAAIGLGVLLLGAIGLGAWGYRGHARSDAIAQATSRALRDAVPQVRVQTVKMLPGSRRVDLPGDVQAFNTTPIYARATGYVLTRLVDIGSKVTQGELLATIAAPEQDQQLAQARATLTQTQASYVQAMANQKLAGVTQGRSANLVVRGYATRQTADNDVTTLAADNALINVSKANVDAQAAEVDRLSDLVGYEKVVAPFNGVITVRNVEVGNLVAANTASGSQMFSIARSDVLRVQIYVPQGEVFGVKDGQLATVTIPELPGRDFHGTVARNADALQAGTRTLLTEVDLDKADGALRAGLYSVVHLDVPRAAPVALVPAEAVIFDKDGLSAAVFDHGVLRLHHLDVLVDNGAELEAQGGLNEGDQLILDPPQLATDGMHVSVAPSRSPATLSR